MASLRSRRVPRLAAGFALAALIVVAMTEPAHAWPRPLTGVAGGACNPDGTRGPVVFVATNLETAFPLSPATIDNVILIPNFPRTGFSPSLLPNTGSSTSTTTVTVPGSWVGQLQITYRLFWDGPDGSDIRIGYADINLDFCFPAVAATRQARRLSSTRVVRAR